MLTRLSSMLMSRTTAAVLTLALALSTGVWAPTQATVIVFKICLVTLAAMIGLWIDRVIFPHARVNTLKEELDKCRDIDVYVREAYISYNLAQVRRAVIVLATVLGVCLGI